MADPPVPSRHLSEREVRFVLKRSAELQRQEAEAVAESESLGAGDLTLADLTDIADEFGVDPYYVERAASELEQTGVPTVPIDLARALGGPFTIRIDRTVDRELPAEELEDLIPEIEMAATGQKSSARALQPSGHVSLGPRSLLWRQAGPDNLLSLQVAVRAQQGRTRIAIEERLHGLAGLLHGLVTGGVGVGAGFGVGFAVGLGVLNSWTFALVFPPALFGGSFLLIRQILVMVARSRKRKLYDLVEVLHEHVADVSEPLEESAAGTSLYAVTSAVQQRAPDLSPQAAPDGTVTLLFSDMEGFTEMTERLGDLRAREVIRAHNAIVREQLAAHEGYEVELQGDGFLLAFRSARRALACAVAIQRAFAARTDDHSDEPIRVRIGLHTGEALKDADKFFGKTVILASRIAAQAQGGEILVSALAKGLVESAGDMRFGAVQEVELKGISERQRVFAVEWD